MKKRMLTLRALIVATAALLLAGCISVNSATPGPSPIAQGPILPGWTPPPVPSVSLEPGFSEIVDKVRPSVVAISTRSISENFFGQRQTQFGEGSGWIIDSDGLIVTNNHVIAGADLVLVTLDDGRTFSVTEEAADPATDLAVLKIDAAGLPAAEVGNSSAIERGMMVAAMGNALGRGISMTGGWISRKGVSIAISLNGGSQTLYDLLETDAAINPGNSGGPLINTAGQVIGITNAKLVSPEIEGVGFAISMDMALPIIEQLVREGQVTRPYLGVSLQTVDAGVAEQLNLAVDSGALVTSVGSGSPASSAGLEQGDVIVEFDGKKITTASELASAIFASKVNQQVEIRYWRGSSENTVQVTLTESPA